MLRPISKQLLLSRRSFGSSPFFRGDDGFDFSDLDAAKVWGSGPLPALYTTATLGAAVTTTGDNVGLLLDRSQGVALGPNLITNGDFPSNFAGWTNQNTPVKTIVGGRAKVDTTGGTEGIWQDTPAVSIGDLHVFDADVEVAIDLGNLDICSTGFGTQMFRAGTLGQNVSLRIFRRDLAVYRVFLVNGFLNGARTSYYDNVLARRVAGNHADQSGSSQRPTWQANGGLPYIAPDKLDDHLRTNLLPGAEMTAVACVRPGSAGALQVFMGAQTAGANNDRFRLSVDAAGLASAAWGAQAEDTVKDGLGANLAGVDCVILLRANAAVLEVWVAVAGGVRLAYSGAPSGTPGANVTQPIYLFANNGTGTAGSFAGGRGYGLRCVKRFIADAEVIPLMRQFGALAGLIF